MRDRLIGRALSEGYRSILPHGVYPVALLFIDVPLEEVDVNVHPAKTEVRFRRAAAVADAVREAVRTGLASAGFAPATEMRDTASIVAGLDADEAVPAPAAPQHNTAPITKEPPARGFELRPQSQQDRIAFGVATAIEREAFEFVSEPRAVATGSIETPQSVSIDSSQVAERAEDRQPAIDNQQSLDPVATARGSDTLPPLDSAIKFVREVPVESLSANIRPLGQLVLSEVLDTVDAEKRGAARANLRDEIAASLACHAAIKVNMPLAPEKMRWLIDRLLLTSSPTTCPHGRPVILRLATQDILKGFHRI